MTLIIDTGVSARTMPGLSRNDAILDGARDGLPLDAPQEAIDAAVTRLIVAGLQRPKTLATVRRHLLGMWPIIADLAFRDPAGFDRIIAEYHELTTVLPEDLSESLSRRKASANG